MNKVIYDGDKFMDSFSGIALKANLDTRVGGGMAPCRSSMRELSSDIRVLKVSVGQSTRSLISLEFSPNIPVQHHLKPRYDFTAYPNTNHPVGSHQFWFQCPWRQNRGAN